MKPIENKKCTFLSMNPTFHVYIKHIHIYCRHLAQKNIKEFYENDVLQHNENGYKHIDQRTFY